MNTHQLESILKYVWDPEEFRSGLWSTQLV
jgi:hypothetical protein